MIIVKMNCEAHLPTLCTTAFCYCFFPFKWVVFLLLLRIFNQKHFISQYHHRLDNFIDVHVLGTTQCSWWTSTFRGFQGHSLIQNWSSAIFQCIASFAGSRGEMEQVKHKPRTWEGRWTQWEQAVLFFQVWLILRALIHIFCLQRQKVRLGSPL